MAIHEDIPGLEATVCVGGQPLKEYRTENEQSDHTDHAVKLHQSLWTITNYVESQSDKEFGVKLSMKHPYIMNCPRLLFTIDVDGQNIYRFVWLKHLYDPKRGESFMVLGPESKIAKKATIRSMRFTKLETTSEDLPMCQVEKDNGLGEIVVTVHRQDLGVPVQSGHDYNVAGVQPGSKVHEKALKGEAKSHGTSFGAARPTRQTVYWADARSIDGEAYPLVTWKFKYRSNEALKKLLVIPRTPEPEPTPPAPYARLTEEQRRRLDAIAERMLNEESPERNESIKKETDGDREDVKPLKQHRATGGENVVINLTDGTDDKPAKRRRTSPRELIPLLKRRELVDLTSGEH